MLMWRNTLPVRAGSKSFAVSIAHARVSRAFVGISEKKREPKRLWPHCVQ